jgi:hypothetical protein
MAFVDVALGRRILDGKFPVSITLAGSVNCGDPLMYSTGWKLSDNTTGAPAILIAGDSGKTGDVIDAYGMALIECTNTSGDVPVLGQQIAVQDTGIYGPAGSGLQDIGYCMEVNADGLHSSILVCGMIVELDLPGT